MLKGFKLERILNESGVSKTVILLGTCAILHSLHACADALEIVAYGDRCRRQSYDGMRSTSMAIKGCC